MAKKSSYPSAIRPYGYTLPPSAIAQAPCSPRDAAKLLVYDAETSSVSHTTFRSLARVLPPRSVVVLNDTKVLPARLRVRRPTGGIVEVFVLQQTGNIVTALMNKVCPVGEVLSLGSERLVVGERAGSEVSLRVSWPASRATTILERYGTTPLPPYLKHSPLTEARRRKEYQSVVAQAPGSVAAPTASLHFTPRLLRQLERAGHTIVRVTLHVGLGTFAHVTAEHLRTNTLHTERYSVSPRAAAQLNAAQASGRPIIAVGTTSARTLESATRKGRIVAGSSTTQIFIRPGYRWKSVDGLITNFHVPYSSLLLLVASAIGRTEVVRLYTLALRMKYRFLSFGDGMFIRFRKKRT